MLNARKRARFFILTYKPPHFVNGFGSKLNIILNQVRENVSNQIETREGAVQHADRAAVTDSRCERWRARGGHCQCSWTALEWPDSCCGLTMLALRWAVWRGFGLKEPLEWQCKFFWSRCLVRWGFVYPSSGKVWLYWAQESQVIRLEAE